MHAFHPILLVDDELECIEIGQRLIRRAGIANPVVIRRDGQEAIDYLRGCLAAARHGSEVPLEPALLLLDLRMPRLDGLQVLRWVRAHSAFDRSRVILWSAAATTAELESAMRCGADAVFAKFPAAAVFGAAVHAALDLYRDGDGTKEVMELIRELVTRDGR